jgi:putative intracellular protease/amidase
MIKEIKMSKRILMIASNYGVWAEELQAPWDALKNAGHELVLATYKGITPLPMEVSLDPDFVDPKQGYRMNPAEVIQRVNEILDTGEWANPIKIADAKMSDYDAIVLIGGPGAAFDIAGNVTVHNLLAEAYQSHKLIGAICAAVSTLAFARRPGSQRSLIYGKRVTAHPRAWDFDFPMNYALARTTPENKCADLITPGFTLPVEYLVIDAVGDPAKVVADENANRENPHAIWDKPFVTALSVESSILFGQRLVEVLASDY